MSQDLITCDYLLKSVKSEMAYEPLIAESGILNPES